jgi:drug/metabolite transporter (DMT)-like permease
MFAYGVVVLSALLFSTKSIFAKLAYEQGAGAIAVLGIRNLLALPVFAAAFWWTNRAPAATPLTARDDRTILLLGFIGYYLASLLDFLGLLYISAGLERIVLFTYPALLLIGTAMARRALPRPAIIVTTLISWVGIALAFGAEARSGSGSLREMLIGTGLVLLSACCYAAFVFIGGASVRRIGSVRCMAAVCTVSGFMVLFHWACTQPLSSITALPRGVWHQGILLAILGTILPSFLTGIGLRLAGPQKFAVISTIGPVGTLILAASFLDESITPLRVVGFVLTLGGGLAASLLPDPRVK